MIISICILLGIFIVFFYRKKCIPKPILDDASHRILETVTDGVLCYDLEENCVYANQTAYGMFSSKPDRQALGRTFLTWKKETRKDSRLDFHEFRKEGETSPRFYEIKKHPLKDEKGDVIGTCYIVYDRTKEVQGLQTEYYRVSHDVLTGLYNRTHFYEKAATLLQENPEERFLMICSDFKDFKFINELFGMEKGNEILMGFSNILQGYPARDAVQGRLENDHFAVCMRKSDFDETKFMEKVDSVCELLDSNAFRLQIYAGVYEIDDINIPVSVMCDRAHMAVGTIKGDYEFKIAYYKEDMMKNLIYEKALISEFDDALEDGQFQIYLQPQTDQYGNAEGAEALVRWIHPERGVIPPGVFIEVFERSGLIYRLDCYVWEQACKKLKEWKEAGKTDKYISVNISARDFYYIDIYETFTGLIEKYEISPSALRLEITETAFIEDLENNLALLEKLQSYGFQVEIDDFGSGYSSLNMLKEIRADRLKIDMLFLRKIEKDERSRIILSIVIKLAQKLGMSVITEGVETEDQLSYLIKEGCDYFQGYYFAKPMPVNEFETKYVV